MAFQQICTDLRGLDSSHCGFQSVELNWAQPSWRRHCDSVQAQFSYAVSHPAQLLNDVSVAKTTAEDDWFQEYKIRADSVMVGSSVNLDENCPQQFSVQLFLKVAPLHTCTSLCKKKSGQKMSCQMCYLQLLPLLDSQNQLSTQPLQKLWQSSPQSSIPIFTTDCMQQQRLWFCMPCYILFCLEVPLHQKLFSKRDLKQSDKVCHSFGGKHIRRPFPEIIKNV